MIGKRHFFSKISGYQFTLSCRALDVHFNYFYGKFTFLIIVLEGIKYCPPLMSSSLFFIQ